MTQQSAYVKSSYYPRPALHRLTKPARRTGRPEASLLREALDDCLAASRSYPALADSRLSH